MSKKRVAGVPASLFGGQEGQMIPLLYFKLQPEVEAACDQCEREGIRTPTRDVVESMTNRIYDNVRSKYPDLAASAREYEKSAGAKALAREYNTEQWGNGALWGLIALLFLGEFFGRRRFRRFR